MPDITLQDGSVVLRDGKVGTEQACCCVQFYCCYESAPSEDPEEPLPPTLCQPGPCDDPALQAGGPYLNLAQCSCQCCKKTICHERVHSKYQVTIGPDGFDGDACQPTAVDDNSPGLIAIDWGFQTCGGQAAEQYCETDWGNRCEPRFPVNVGDVKDFPQYYDRFRAVNDCEDCIDTGGAPCNPGVELLSCWAWDNAGEAVQNLVCSCAAAETFCNNPFP